ncbi:MAG: S-adenosylmethionine decarboxylase [Candidatus Marinamargulisbacteria bacterium]|jgi:S-adenosylmethionine decarboxylase
MPHSLTVSSPKQATDTTQGYGPHRLDDLGACFNFLNMAPQVFRYGGLVPDDQGITGVVVIAESHVSAHTYPLKNDVFIGLFSYKPFDTEAAKNACIGFFKSHSPKHHLVTREQNFHESHKNIKGE